MAASTEALPQTELQTACPVSSYNEWDPLEEVIVGRLEGSTVPPGHVTVTYDVPRPVARLVKIFGGMRYPRWFIKAAQKHLDGLLHILEAEGVTVRRPEICDFSRRYRTPHWSSRGFTIACPRDAYLVIGDEIIETPMAWRSRYFESVAYRPLFQKYFEQGARWSAAPKPRLLDSLYDNNYRMPTQRDGMTYVVNESEPVFDAADFMRCGKDIFYQRSNVTNYSGVRWLERHLGDRYRIHEIRTECLAPMHIDSSLVPLAPGKLLISPEYLDVKKLPPMFKSWDVIVAPEPDPVSSSDTMGKFFSMCSKWIALNVLNLDEERVIVEQSQTTMIRTLRDYGFKPIPCPFVNYTPFGGAFHCATLDVRRRGSLQSYF